MISALLKDKFVCLLAFTEELTLPLDVFTEIDLEGDLILGVLNSDSQTDGSAVFKESRCANCLRTFAVSQVTREDDLNTLVKYTIDQKENTCTAYDECLFSVSSSGADRTKTSAQKIAKLQTDNFSSSVA